MRIASIYLVALVALVLPVSGYCAAGKVEFAIGNVTAIGKNGQPRPLSKGLEIDSGDTINTADNGRAQLRFTDGGYISLQPNTQFRVDEYHYEGKVDGNEKGFYSLVKGGLRAITGVIGHANKTNFHVKTPVATIGIRGTEFLAQYNDKLLVKVGNGAVYMSNATGDLVLFSGQSGEVSGEGSKPQYSNEEPTVTAAGPQGNKPGEVEQQNQQDQQQSDTFKVAEQYGDDGTSCVVTGSCPVTDSAGPTAFKTLTSQAITIAHYDDEPGDEISGELESALSGTVELDASGRITRISDPSGSFSVSNITGTFLDNGSDGAITWARLNGGTVLVTDEDSTHTANITNAHFIYGSPTPASDISALSSHSAIASYDFVGGTRPTDGLGNVGALRSASLCVDFGNYTVSANLAVAMTSGPAAAGGSDGVYSVSSYNSNNLSNTGQFLVTNADDCSSNCFVGVGFLAGPNAGQAGMSYAIDSGTAAGTITGVAAFKKGLPPPPPS